MTNPSTIIPFPSSWDGRGLPPEVQQAQMFYERDVAILRMMNVAGMLYKEIAERLHMRPDYIRLIAKRKLPKEAPVTKWSKERLDIVCLKHIPSVVPVVQKLALSRIRKRSCPVPSISSSRRGVGILLDVS